MSVTEEPRVPWRDRIRDELRARIGDGRLRPGDRLFEQELARDFGVSRVPVREAIRMLQSEGLVDVLPQRRGVFVRSLDRRQLEELFDVREALESLAARLGAEGGRGGVADPLGELSGRSRRAWEDGDEEAMSEANTAFHEELVALAGNQRWLRCSNRCTGGWPGSTASTSNRSGCAGSTRSCTPPSPRGMPTARRRWPAATSAPAASWCSTASSAHAEFASAKRGLTRA